MWHFRGMIGVEMCFLKAMPYQKIKQTKKQIKSNKSNVVGLL